MDAVTVTEAMRLRDRLLSDGHVLPLANATAAAQMLLSWEASELKLLRCKREPPKKHTIKINSFGDAEQLLRHDGVLLPAWQQFAEALSSVDACQEGYLCLGLRQVQLEKVPGLLLRAFETAPLKMLALTKNDLGRSGLAFAAKAIETNATLELLAITDNRIEAADEAAALVRAVKGHRRLTGLYLNECGIGRSHGVLAAIVSSFHSLTEINLRGNAIGAQGATLIADCLAGNPGLQQLFLEDNLLNDDDATRFAIVLATNTKLQWLKLAGNHITEAGMFDLQSSVCDVSSLNAVSDSNHTCLLDFGPEDSRRHNPSCDARLNRGLKLLGTLMYVNRGHVQHLVEEAPLELVPRVLALLQGGHLLDAAEYISLNEVFLFVREWNMPLLFTSGMGPALRRSERLRKKRVV